ncbi:hypothetical protein SNEBB_007428, partial [Seison nebaliae]
MSNNNSERRKKDELGESDIEYEQGLMKDSESLDDSMETTEKLPSLNIRSSRKRNVNAMMREDPEWQLVKMYEGLESMNKEMRQVRAENKALKIENRRLGKTISVSSARIAECEEKIEVMSTWMEMMKEKVEIKRKGGDPEHENEMGESASLIFHDAAMRASTERKDESRNKDQVWKKDNSNLRNQLLKNGRDKKSSNVGENESK